MATKPKQSPKSGSRYGWKGFAVFLLTFIGLVSLVLFTWAHWTERQLLTTDNYVKLVAPLPKNEQVANSLSDYAVNQLFTGIDLQQKITDALPSQASFLAAPLTNQLTIRTKALGSDLIQSDKFQGVWITANRTAHKTLVDKARGETSTSSASSKLGAKFNLDLSSLGSNIRDKLGSTSLPLFDNQGSSKPSGDKIGIGVALKTSFEKFKKFVNVVDFANGVLAFLAFACLLWAIAITKRRRRLIMIVSATVGVIALLQIIGVKAVRPYILNQIETQSYRPAVSVVYDTLVATLQHGAMLLFILSLLVFTTAFLWGWKHLTANKSTVKYLKLVKSQRAYKELRNMRQLTANYRFYLMGATGVIVLLIVATMNGYDGETVVRAGLVVIIVCAIIRLFALLPSKTTRGKAPM